MRILLALLVVLFFAGCSSDDDKDVIDLKSSDVSLTYDKEFKIDAESKSEITYTSENTYHATVSESGVITAGRVGETNIILFNGEDVKKLKVTVKPESNLYPEPNMEFGISRSDLIKKLGNPDFSTESGIGYNDYSVNAPQVAYLFDEDDKLTTSTILLKSSVISHLSTFLGERYVPVGSQNYTIYLVNALKIEDASMGIAAGIYNISYWMIVYAPYSTGIQSNMEQQKSAIVENEWMKKELELLFDK